MSDPGALTPSAAAPPAWPGTTLGYRLPMLRGDLVRTVQRRLSALGYARETGADGIFGPNTRAAVRDFQSAHGLASDGEVGPKTWAALVGASARPRTPAPAAVPTPVRRPSLPRVPAAVTVSAPTPPSTAVVSPPPTVVPAEWLPPATPERIICHWTAGGYRASDLDRRHYHLLVEGDGTVRRGEQPISANDRPIAGAYAAHTRNKNTGSIGLAVCAMAGARERPFDAGRAPLTRAQWRRLAAVAAQLCHRYGLAVTPETVLGHGEVERILHVPQRAKWDPLVLPWRPELDQLAVGEAFRDEVRAALHLTDEVEAPVELATDLDGLALADSLDFDCHVRLAIRALMDDPRVTVADVDDEEVTLVYEDRAPLYLPWETPPGTVPDPALPPAEAARLAGYVRAEDVAVQLGLEIAVNDGRIGLARPRTPAGGDAEHFVPVVLGPGDTLRALAATRLGDPARWREIRDRAGERISADAARSLVAGTTVLVPRAEGGPRGGDVERDRAALMASVRPWHREWAVEAIALLVARCRAEGLEEPAQIAYVLATAEHESHFGKLMVEAGDAARWRAYEGRYGNDRPGDGKRYRGRGYVQITFKANYAKFRDLVGVDLVGEPERAADPEIAAAIAVLGMRDGLFRGERLDTHVGDGRRDFVGARAVINADADRYDEGDPTGTPRGARIAARAETFLAGLG